MGEDRLKSLHLFAHVVVKTSNLAISVVVMESNAKIRAKMRAARAHLHVQHDYFLLLFCGVVFVETVVLSQTPSYLRPNLVSGIP